MKKHIDAAREQWMKRSTKATVKMSTSHQLRYSSKVVMNSVGGSVFPAMSLLFTHVVPTSRRLLVHIDYKYEPVELLLLVPNANLFYEPLLTIQVGQTTN